MSPDLIFPKPREWNTFEDIVCDVFARKYNNLNFQRYGRSGQRQAGVDIAGQITNGVLGIQCKHHPEKSIEKTEIDAEIVLSETFKPGLCEYIIATSADRDTYIHSYVLQISEERKKAGKYPVSIKFWDDIFNWLSEYPDLLYKHLTKYFPKKELEEIYLPDLENLNKHTLFWPVLTEDLKANIISEIGNIKKLDPFELTLSVTRFPDISFKGKVDLELSLAEFDPKDKLPEDVFRSNADIFKSIRATLNDPFFAKDIILFPQVRLSTAFLVGWIFRRVTGYKMLVKSPTHYWATEGLPFVPTGLIDSSPLMMSKDCRDAVVILNISRDISRSVVDFVTTWKKEPYCILPFTLEGLTVTSAAHALSLAYELSRKIKSLIDNWGVQKIHLFSAMPTALAVLVSHNLNAICPISIYFMNETRTKYLLGGILENNL